MSADSPDDGSDSTDPWDVQALRKLVPGTLGSEGTRALVCAIRNPDATTGQVAEKVGASSTYTVENALRSAVQEADRGEVEYGQAQERRGEARDAQEYAELTDKQQAIVDFAAENPTFTEDRTWADVAQAIQEQQGTVVNETYVGQVLRKYPQILHRQRALAASEGEAEVELEDALSEMTMREVLGAAGYDLPDENLDSMPEASTSDPAQATLGDARDAEASEGFQTGSEVADEQEQEAEGEGTEDEDEQPTSSTFLDDGWLEQHADVPGAGQAQRLPDDAEDEDVKQNTAYWAYVNGVAPYGVFVSLTNPAYGDDVSGLVATERLYGKKDSLERGQPLVVELDHRNAKGLAFTDWRLLHPDALEQQGEAEGTEDTEQPDDTETTPEVEQPAVPGEVLYRLEGLETAVDTLREDAVFASEMREFGDRVDEALEDLREAVDTVETAQAGTVQEALETAEAAASEMEALEDRVMDQVDDRLQNSVGRAVVDQAEAAEQEARAAQQKANTMQEMVNSLAEQVQEVQDAGGSLGRAQQALGRLEAQGADVQAYEYSEQGGTVTLHVEATLDRTRQASLDEAATEGEN